MIVPDSRCEIHGETLVVYGTVDRGRSVVRTHCRACLRENYRKRRGGLIRNSPLDPRCKNGHPKTKFNYGMYGGQKRCIVCNRERGRMKR